jgi:hypothetical protein
MVAAGLWLAYRATHPPWAGTEAWAKYQQIRMGMSPQEADAILGERQDRPIEMTGALGGTEFTWKDGEDRVVVWFENDKKVGQKRAMIQGHLFADPPLKKSSWDRWRDWLGWSPLRRGVGPQSVDATVVAHKNRWGWRGGR